MKLVRGNGTISAHECACASADCVPLKSCKQLRLLVFEMYGKQGLKAVHKTVHVVKLIGKGCPFFLVLISSYLWYKPRQQQNKLIQFPVCAQVGVLFSLEKSATGLREAHTNSIFPFAISVLELIVLHRQKCYVMFQCIECYLTEVELGIRFQ